MNAETVTTHEVMGLNGGLFFVGSLKFRHKAGGRCFFPIDNNKLLGTERVKQEQEDKEWEFFGECSHDF